MELVDLKEMKWPDLVTMMNEKFIVVATSSDAVLREAAVLTKNYGAEAGASFIAAEMLAEANPKAALSEGVVLYRELAKKLDIPKLREQVFEMESWTAWNGIPYYRAKGKDWPVRIPREVLMSHGGHLNFLLFAGLKYQKAETNAAILAQNGVMYFLKWITGLKGGLRSLRKRKAS